MKNLANLFLGFVSAIFFVVIGFGISYFSIPNFKSCIDDLITPSITETFDLSIETENASVKVMQGDKEIRPGEKVLKAGAVYKVTVASNSVDFYSNYFYLNGKLYQNGAEIVCDSNFEISSVVVGTYDLTINYINCEGLDLRDITNAPSSTPNGVIYIGFEVMPGENVLYEGQVLRVTGTPFPIYDGKEFVQAVVNDVVFTNLNDFLGYEFIVTSDINITFEYAQIEEEPVALPASYFTFDDGALTGFSAEGQSFYDSGELTELVLPSSYSFGELVTEEVTYYDFFELEMYCMENGYNFTFVNSEGETVAITSEEEFFDNYETLRTLLEENQSITVTMQVQKFVDGTDVGVTSLGGSCFQNCTSLTSIIIPNSVTSLGINCFLGCSVLASITIPNSVTSLGGGCFLGCSALISVTIPNSVTSLGNSCFNSCTSLTSIDIPNSVTSLGGSCFQNCTSLTSIIIPNSVTSLGNECFYGCSALASITIPNSVTSLSDGCFQNCTSLISINIPNSVASLGNGCFQDCTSLTSITIPNTVTSLGSQCFYRCTSLTSITIPNSVTSLGSTCFAYCSALTSITIPNSVTSLGNECLYGCSALISVTVQSSNCTLGTNVFGNTNNCPIYVPAGALEAYKVATNWSTYADRLQAISA